MFGSTDSVDTAPFSCGSCRQPLFVLMDDTQNPNQPTQVIGLGCCSCKSKEQRVVIPTMSEHAGSGQPIQALPFQQLPPNALLCGQNAAIGKLAPQGVCHGAVFRVYERGNELLSKCANCGAGDSIGMINAATG
jgi:hypothetical protein